jgi:hypothetical protein
MKKLKLVVVIILSFYSCKENNQEKSKQIIKSNSEKTIKKCQPYFDFDKIEHYFINADELEVLNIDEKEEKTDSEKKLVALLLESKPNKLSDSLILENIEGIGFTKTEIQESKFQQLNEVFCERKHDELIETACIAVYRDILVFKNKNKIIGIAKICFGCDKNIITGTMSNTTEFGQSGDYRKLYEVLH